MPHINRIRVNNVKYNFGTQFYDDFILRFSGKNTIYDLANGGGKSVLMLLLLQNLIPNCTLDEKQPIEKLFRGNGSTVIHSLVEWKLNDNHVQDGYKYMTTGFCARKGKESREETAERENAAIEYFNYCIFYREFNDNDLRNLPLSNGKERITYQGLKNYLRDLEKHDFGLIVKIFDRKGDYQRFIAGYGLYESEWELIRGINKTEGHVRTYFETRYRTTRKVVEDLLIEEIIQKSFRNKIGGGDGTEEIARTLLDIKDKLMELSRKKGELAHYDMQIEAISSFTQRLHNLKGVYQQKSGLEEELARTYHTALSRQKFKEEQLSKGKETKEQLSGEVRRLERQIAWGRIQAEEEELSRLEKEAAATQELLKKYREEGQNLESGLKRLENANDYLTYLEDKKQADIQEEAMAGRMKEKEGLLEELYDLASEIKEKSEGERRRLEETVQALLSAVQAEKAKKEEAEARQLVLEKRGAVLENRISETERMREQLLEEARRLQKETGILIPQQAGQERKEKEKERDRIAVRKGELKENGEKYREELILLRVEQAESGEKERRLRKQLEENARFMEESGRQRERAEHLREIYKERDYGRLLSLIYKQQKDTVVKLARKQEQLLETESLLENLNEGMPMVPSEETYRLAEYIGRHHETKVQLGQEYLMETEGFEREVLLSNFPMLPYAILVDGDFSQIAQDYHIGSADYGNAPIPVLSVEALSLKDGLGQEEYLYIAGKNPELFLEESKSAALRTETEKQREELLLQIERLKDQEEVLREDYGFLNTFVDGYGKQLAKAQQDYEADKASLLELEQLKKRQAEREEEREKALEAAGKELALLEAEDEQTGKTVRLLAELEEIVRKAVSLQGEETSLRAKHDDAAEESRKIDEELKIIRENERESRKKAEIAGKKKEALEADWERLYGPYEKEGRRVRSGLSLEELQVRFAGRREAFEKEHGDLEDKKRLVESLKTAMERTLSAIEYRGGSLKSLQEAFDANELTMTAKEELLKLRSQLAKAREAEALAAKQFQAQADAINRKFGSIGHAKTMAEEQFGSYEASDAAEGRKERLEADRTLLAEKQERQKAVLKEEKELERQCIVLENMCQDMERMMKLVGITPDAAGDLLDGGVSLKERYEKLREQYEGLMREEQRRRSVFEKDKERLLETLAKMQAFAFSEEIKHTVNYPVSLAEAERLISNLAETVSYIELEKDRVGKGIEDMEIIRDNFENQCLQTCITIKRELERLPEMSRIQLDGQTVPMIQLSIPYIGKERFKESMSAYIEEIVQNADGFEKQEERLRYIRNQLAFKRLFSVIVRDMDKIRLTLYKRERIREQSRYLKYEEAVGSTGQSQGIYIQFLIAIIHYITSINSGNADAIGLKNVLFIDNPFGAAKDIYIWEPIFALLKSNHVQLIVPARGVTPAITGRFEVNYILGQKLVDGRQQTVVTDYRSQVEEEELEYAPLAFEQAELF